MSAGQQAFGVYLLFERIAEGPFGVTYRGLDQRDGQRVILRQAGAETPGQAALEREAQLLRRIAQVSRAQVWKLVEASACARAPLRLSHPLLQLFAAKSRAGNHGNVAGLAVLSEHPECLESVHVRHHQVHQHEVRAEPCHREPGLKA